MSLQPNGLNLESILKMTRPVTLEGGLRCTTTTQTLSCDLVIKKGEREELERQVTYIQNLPEQFRQLFPKIISLQNESGTELSVLVMEKIEGPSLHAFLYDPFQTSSAKLMATEIVLTKLTELHQYPIEEGFCLRDSTNWIEAIRQRVTQNLFENTLASPYLTEIIAILDDKGLQEKFLASKTEKVKNCIIHGDAQAGNFLVITKSGIIEIGFIDPLGGSGKSPGDYVYDLSRFFHWIDCAGMCYEIENRSLPVFFRRQNSFLPVRDAIRNQVFETLKKSSQIFEDRDAVAWFYLYSAFHLSGKLSNFRSDQSTETLAKRLAEYLRKALNRPEDS